MTSADAPASDAADLAEAVAQCRANGHFLAALTEIYAACDAAVSAAALACRACGECCRFDRAEHRLYASAGELAALAQTPVPRAPCRPLRCPYQVADACTARADRPLGCRVFFCGPAAAAATRDLYEQFHTRIRRLHDEHGLPYAYVELTAAGRRLPAFFRILSEPSCR